MDCPKCAATMDVIDFQEVSIDRCVNCGGIWLDYLELERLRELPDAASLDLGDEVDASYDEMVYVECPRCYSILDSEEKSEPTFFRYEVCRTCAGSFFDAGELKRMLART